MNVNQYMNRGRTDLCWRELYFSFRLQCWLLQLVYGAPLRRVLTASRINRCMARSLSCVLWCRYSILSHWSPNWWGRLTMIEDFISSLRSWSWSAVLSESWPLFCPPHLMPHKTLRYCICIDNTSKKKCLTIGSHHCWCVPYTIHLARSIWSHLFLLLRNLTLLWKHTYSSLIP